VNIFDWSIIIFFLLCIVGIAIYTKRYTKDVAGFLSADRCAGRYLLTIADGVAGVGAITLIANFEKYHQTGFPGLWWDAMMAPIAIIIALSGWVIYRYRQTRALTMAQFFEIRYSRKFRIFSGILAWLSGILNYGIFPAITARFFIYFCGIPQKYVVVGPLELNITLGLVMFVLLSMAVVIVFYGGQIAVMMTDFFQGQLMYLVFIAITVFLLFKFGWSGIVETIKKSPPGLSKINPFQMGSVQDFGPIFFVILSLKQFYGYLAWQGNQGYNCAAKSPHEARMARVLGSWRANVVGLMMIVIPVCVWVLLNGNLFPAAANATRATIESISDPHIQKQMITPIGVLNLLPHGFLGLFCAIMIAGSISTDNTYLHSWGTIFIQDVIMPLRKNKEKFSPEKHLKLLRYSVISVALFAWVFSMIFPLKEYIIMWFQITAALYIGGAGSAIIGGLYWKRGTTAGAWGGMITGSVLATLGIFLRNIFWPYMLPSLKVNYENIAFLNYLPSKFPYNGVVWAFFTACAAISVYVIVSLFTKPDPDFDMDRMLNRGKWSNEKNKEKKATVNIILKRLGVSEEFTAVDKIIYFSVLGLGLFWFSAFVVGSLIHKFAGGISDDGWARWWLFKIVLVLFIAAVTSVWFLWGGILDLIAMIKKLSVAKVNVLDDGSVIGHHIADEKEISKNNNDSKNPTGQN